MQDKLLDLRSLDKKVLSHLAATCCRLSAKNIVNGNPLSNKLWREKKEK